MPTRNELLAAHFIKVADITAVYADATGAIGTVDVVEIDAPSGWVQLCCTAGKQIRIAAKAAARVADGTDQAAALELRSVAADAAWTDAASDGHPARCGGRGNGRSKDCGPTEDRRHEGHE
jgi:hypothetical protein